MWYRQANQFGAPTPFVPEANRPMGSNEAEHIAPAPRLPATDFEAMTAWEKRKKELANPKEDPYTKTLEGQLANLHHETKNELDPNAAEAEKLWRGDGIKDQSDATTPNKNWPSSLGNVQV